MFFWYLKIDSFTQIDCSLCRRLLIFIMFIMFKSIKIKSDSFYFFYFLYWHANSVIFIPQDVLLDRNMIKKSSLKSKNLHQQKVPIFPFWKEYFPTGLKFCYFGISGWMVLRNLSSIRLRFLIFMSITDWLYLLLKYSSLSCIYTFTG